MTIWRISCCKTKTIDIYSEYVILIAFHGNNSYTNAHQCYVYTYTARLVFLVEMLMATVGIECGTI